ncbi:MULTISPECIES: oleate hydratase [unclassified Haloferax]|uniref:oleate hydratase n=1 Tax=unclassified Haloferax TaxID=2625095 RepID=UPI000E220530|nr:MULTISPECIES: oleate hydratase [unclassified Haloferax]RDZ34100.1 oleate hydratase [Haloferax sp. Atlit-24N]RLM36196.1 oleate hydratase [Haloferax sp. Atlit-109R]RLM41600.1 oleate hydratase [Haloferax sp. Atlit-105R]
MTDTVGTEADAAERDAYFVGGGIASLAGAAFLLRDTEIPGENVHVLEKRQVFGGALDGRGTPEEGYVLPGGRMFNFPTYECTWNLFRSIPSLEDPDTTIKGEMDEFNEKHETYAEARLVGADQEILDVSSYGFETQHRLSLLRLLLTPEERLGETRIEEWFDETFFDTTFWYLWATTFAFQPWHSAAEMRRYMQRFTREFPRLHTLSGVSRTKYNQYDSVVRPLRRWLEARGVDFLGGHAVTDLDIVPARAGKTVETIRYEDQDGSAGTIAVEPTDVVFVTNGSMTDALSLGSMTEAPDLHDSGTSFELWKALADDFPEFGRPSVFADHVPESKWESFTLTLREPDFLEHVVEVTREEPGNALVTFTESNWLLSIVTAVQPHFANQPDDVKVIWGYGLFPEERGNHVNKKMEDCTGEEILAELCHHLGYTDRLEELRETATCIPCMMPFITSQFMPRTPGDRPEVVPAGSNNLAFLGQFAEVPDDVVFTVEYSVRSALMAVHELFDAEGDVPPVSTHQYEPDVLLDTVRAAFR